MKYKALRVIDKRSAGFLGETLAIVKVTGIPKHQINAEWDRLDKKYSPEFHVSSLETRGDEHPCTFEKPPHTSSGPLTSKL